eukprot:scaffold7146_cov115-Isochrysis_galbana.AAC.7
MQINLDRPARAAGGGARLAGSRALVSARPSLTKHTIPSKPASSARGESCAPFIVIGYLAICGLCRALCTLYTPPLRRPPRAAHSGANIVIVRGALEQTTTTNKLHLYLASQRRTGKHLSISVITLITSRSSSTSTTGTAPPTIAIFSLTGNFTGHRHCTCAFACAGRSRVNQGRGHPLIRCFARAAVALARSASQRPTLEPRLPWHRL